MPRPAAPPARRWTFPADVGDIAQAAGEGEVVGVGADLEPGTILAAYRHGLFPMPVRRGALAWWSPDPRRAQREPIPAQVVRPLRDPDRLVLQPGHRRLRRAPPARGLDHS